MAEPSSRFEAIDPRLTTAGLTAIAYALVIGTFYDLIPWYPSLSRETIDLLSHAIAVVNSAAIVVIGLGLYFVKHRKLRRHAVAMGTATVLIVVFLVLYLVKIGGGGQKEIVGAEGAMLAAYLAMLAIHVLLSILAVPLVIFALTLAATVPMNRLGATRHPQVGRLAAITWLVSLVLGVVTYVMLNHMYDAQLA